MTYDTEYQNRLVCAMRKNNPFTSKCPRCKDKSYDYSVSNRHSVHYFVLCPVCEYNELLTKAKKGLAYSFKLIDVTGVPVQWSTPEFGIVQINCDFGMHAYAVAFWWCSRYPATILDLEELKVLNGEPDNGELLTYPYREELPWEEF